jgi:hypothetical protein
VVFGGFFLIIVILYYVGVYFTINDNDFALEEKKKKLQDEMRYKERN